jgi:hypothetical protein
MTAVGPMYELEATQVKDRTRDTVPAIDPSQNDRFLLLLLGISFLLRSLAKLASPILGPT